MDTDSTDISELEWYDRNSGNFLAQAQGYWFLVEFELDPSRPNQSIGIRSIQRWSEADSLDDEDDYTMGVAAEAVERIVAGIGAQSLLARFEQPVSTFLATDEERLWVRVDWDSSPVNVIVDGAVADRGTDGGSIVFSGSKTRAETFAKSLRILISRWAKKSGDHSEMASRLKATLQPISTFYDTYPQAEHQVSVAEMIERWLLLRTAKRDQELEYEVISAFLLEGVAMGWTSDQIAVKSQTRTTFDLKRFKSDHPHLWAEYSQRSNSIVLSPKTTSRARSASGNSSQLPKTEHQDGKVFASFAAANDFARALATQGVRARTMRVEGGFKVSAD
ncbi:MAG: hypothetical protein WCT47_01255 [Betaproteobacteria bacterium]